MPQAARIEDQSRMKRIGRWLATALVVACALAPAAQAQIKLRIGYAASSDFATAFVAQEEGFFARHGIEAELIFTGQAGLQTAALVGGSLDIGIGQPPAFFQANARGLDMVAIAGGVVTSRDLGRVIGLIARTGSNIGTPGDLVGKRVAVGTIGGTNYVVFQAWLRQNRVDPKRVAFVEIPLASQSDAMKSRSIDAALPVDPVVSRMIAAGTGYYVADYLAVAPEGIPIVFYQATRSWADAHRDAVEGFRAAIADGAAFIGAEPDKARLDVATFVKMPPDVMANMVMARPMPVIDPGQFTWWAGTLVELGLLDRAPDDLDRLIFP